MKKGKSIFPILILLAVLLVCCIGPVVSPWSADEQFLELRNQGPSMIHIFGTDALGRDSFVRVCIGGRNSLLIAFVCTIVTGVFGCLYGGLAALVEKLDKLLLPMLDVLVSIPDVLVVLTLGTVIRHNNVLVMCAIICVLGWCKMAKLTRDQLKPLRYCDYVIQSRLNEKHGFYIVCHHLLPNILPSIISRAVLSFSEFIFYESFLSYIGVGLKPPHTSWGNLISGAQSEFMAHPYQIFTYCLPLVITLLTVNYLGDLLRPKESTFYRDDEEIPLETAAGRTDTDQRARFGPKPLLEVEGLSVTYPGSTKKTVDCASFSIHSAECIGLIGQSGCGKSTLAKAISGILSMSQPDAKLEGVIRFNGNEIDIKNPEQRKQLLGLGGIAIIHQDAVSSLDPTMRIGKQLLENVKLSAPGPKKVLEGKAVEYLRMVGLGGDVKERMKQYPNQLSGGIAQRVVIAMTLAMRPTVLICDEPTASLDPLNQRRIIELLKRVAAEQKIALLFISHDIKNIGRVASKCLSMSEGKLRLLDGMPEKEAPARKPFQDHHTESTLLYLSHLSAAYDRKNVVDDVSFKLQRGEAFGILGESGSGKTSLVRAILKKYAGVKQIPISVRSSPQDNSSERLQTVQYISQNPYASFDPHWTIGRSLSEGKPGSIAMRDRLLQTAGLDASILERRPAELSIGQCQRAAIVRALLHDPNLLICDEPTSSMDAAHEKAILELLKELIADQNTTCIFITHDIDVAACIADRIAVMYRGRMVEIAPSTQFFDGSVHHPYTEMFLSEGQPQGDTEAMNGSGCVFCGLCKYQNAKCSVRQPSLMKATVQDVVDNHHFIACCQYEKEANKDAGI